MSNDALQDEVVSPPTTGRREPTLTARVCAALGQLALLLLWLWQLVELRQELLSVVVPVAFLATGCGLLIGRSSAVVAAKLVNWPVFVISGCLVLCDLLFRLTKGGSLVDLEFYHATCLASLWTLAWLGGFDTVRRFRVKHWLVLTAVVSCVLGVLSFGDFRDKAVVAAVSTLFECLVLIQLANSWSAFHTPGVIQTRAQAMGHGVALAVLWIFPVLWLFAATFGIPVPFAGWTHGLKAAVITPVLIGFYAILGGWLVLPVLIGIGLKGGASWWKQEHLTEEAGPTAADGVSGGTAAPEKKPYLFVFLLSLMVVVFVAFFIALIVAAS